jgi:hypothetical protein
MDRLTRIKTGLESDNQDDWLTFDDIYWLIEQAEKVAKLEIENTVLRGEAEQWKALYDGTKWRL